jgi:hypothetical protein
MLAVTNDVALRLLKVAYRRALGSPENLYTDDLANDLAQEIRLPDTHRLARAILITANHSECG